MVIKTLVRSEPKASLRQLKDVDDNHNLNILIYIISRLVLSKSGNVSYSWRQKNYASLSRQLDVVSIAKYPTAGGVGGCCGGSLKEDYRARHHLRTGTHRSISQ